MRIIDVSDYMDLAAVTANANGESQQLEYMTGFSFHCIWTATTVSATVTVQCSNDGTNWEDVAGTTENITADGSVMYNVSDVYYKYVRLQITYSSGTITTFVAKFYAKG